MAILKFINGRNTEKAGLIRAIDYITNEEKTELTQKQILENETKFIENLLKDSSAKRAINYITKDGKTSLNLTTGINCSPETAFTEMMITKQLHNKMKGRQFIHFTHSFSNKEKLDPMLAHELSLKLLEHENFKGYEILTATHTDTKHIHTHFILNTVNAETGLKWQQSKKDLENLKKLSNKLCFEYGLKHSIVDTKTNKFIDKEHISIGEHSAKSDRKSWKYEAYLAINECSKISTSKKDFIKNLNKVGYGVRWVDSRKNITFTLPNGRKLNNDKLHPPKKFTKEALGEKFKNNQKFQDQIKHQDIQETFLRVTNLLSKSSNQENKDLPFTYLEGQALKEKTIENKKGKGIDFSERQER